MTKASIIDRLLDLSGVHEEWRAPLTQALCNVDADYLESILRDGSWLPGKYRLFAAFQRDLHHCRYILFGESPYPRAESANGIAFYDAAVNELWSDNGLSKAVNRATSLRNIIKTALLAEGLLPSSTGGRVEQSAIAAIDKSGLVQTIHELFANLQDRGFLLFNATPVLHPSRSPASEARHWHGFTGDLLRAITPRIDAAPTLVLWGRIAEKILAHPVAGEFPVLKSEHPYNTSFIRNREMQHLFSTIRMLQKNALPEQR